MGCASDHQEYGWNRGEMGKEGLISLEGIENATANGVDGQCCFLFRNFQVTESAYALMNVFHPDSAAQNRLLEVRIK